jgi:hypothetical protein
MSKRKGYKRESQSPYIVHLLFVPETQLKSAENELWIVIDYRVPNSMIIMDYFSQSILEGLINCYKGSLIFQK